MLHPVKLCKFGHNIPASVSCERKGLARRMELHDDPFHFRIYRKDCVFTTPNYGEQDTVWHVTQYDPSDYIIEFLRVTPGENVVRINICLEKVAENETNAHIRYQYTALNEEANFYIDNQLKDDFCTQMKWWEKAINHHLETGEKLLKE